MMMRSSSRLLNRFAQPLNRTSVTSAAKTAGKGRGFLGFAAAGAFVAGGAILATNSFSANDAVPAGKYPWAHDNFFTTFDHMSIRRGFQVYREVCAACHSLRHIYWRHLVGVVGTESEVKEWAAEHTYVDGEDVNGDPIERDGLLVDRMPLAFPNDDAAREANGGALPPELSLMKKARHDGSNYIFSLLTGYREAPAGYELREGLYYNPYFPGGALGMAQVIYDDVVEYEDGTEASISQLAKDVTTFLCWTAEPEHDERKKLGWKVIFFLSLMIVPTFYWKRFKWSVITTRQVRFAELPKRFY